MFSKATVVQPLLSVNKKCLGTAEYGPWETGTLATHSGKMSKPHTRIMNTQLKAYLVSLRTED